MAVKLFISKDQQRQLARLLEECPSMQEERTRKLILKNLDPDIQSKIDSKGAYGIVVREMILHSADHPDGIEDLIRATADIERESIPMRQVWEALPALLGFSYPENYETVSCVLRYQDNVIPRKALETAFQNRIPKALRDDLELPGVKYLCRWRMLREAESLPPGPDGVFPFARFIRFLLSELSKPSKGLVAFVRTLLVRWAVHVTGEPAASFRGLPKTEPVSQLQGASNSHLTVQLVQNPLAPERFKAVFPRKGEEGSRDYQPTLSRKYPNEFLPQDLIGRELDSFLCRLDEDHPEDIEIIVSAESITALKPPPHLWPLEEGRQREALLGQEYTVYFRLNRYTNVAQKLREKWKKNWRKLAEADSFEELVNCEADPNTCSYSSLKRKMDGIKGSPCLMLTFDPEMTPADRWFPDILLDCGIPVALWGNCDEADIRKLLDGGSHRRLPEKILEHRQGTDEKLDLPHLVTLLWDNPEREIRPVEFDDKQIPAPDMESKYHYDMDLPI